jgi:7-keto-8-aminopelargonate synthetase-like enzyme
MSNEYEFLIARLNRNLSLLTDGLGNMGLAVLGGQTPIISVLVGDEADTLNAGMFLFDKGYYVQSVTFPAVPYHAGVLRIQVNANHTTQAVKGLINAFGELKKRIAIPGPEPLPRQAA